MSIPNLTSLKYDDITEKVRQEQHAKKRGADLSYSEAQNGPLFAASLVPGVKVPGSNSYTESNQSRQVSEVKEFEPNRKRRQVSKLDGRSKARDALIKNTDIRANKKQGNVVLDEEKGLKKVGEKSRKLPKVRSWAVDQIGAELDAESDDEQDLEKVNRREKWAMLSALRDLIPWHRACSCCRVPLPENVSGVRGVQLLQRPKNGDRKASARFGNVGQCGNVWVCPICAPKIARGRAEELNRALIRHVDEGGRLMHVTLTHRHTRDDVLEDQLACQGRAFQAMHRNREYRELCAAHGVIGSVKSLELTHSESNGWHAHIHLLLFIAGTEEQAQRHAEHMSELDAQRANYSGKKRDPVGVPKVRKLTAFGREYIGLWRKYAKKQGLVAAWDAQKAEIASDDLATLEKLASYLTKADSEGKNTDNLDAFDGNILDHVAAVENVEKAGSQTKSDAAKEVALGALKLGRDGGRTPMQYLKDFAVSGDLYAGALFVEFAIAINGRCALNWSRGLKALYDVKTLTDEEVLLEEERKAEGGEVLVGELSPREWAAVLAGPRLSRAHLLEMAKNLDLSGIEAMLTRLVAALDSRATGPP